jgi:16S rRNA U1498 N3-methylase RsmE
MNEIMGQWMVQEIERLRIQIADLKRELRAVNKALEQCKRATTTTIWPCDGGPVP